MTITVVSFDDRSARHVAMSWEMNQAYCERYGHRFETHKTFDQALPPWWVKVFLVKRYLDQCRDSDSNWYVWLDSDAFLRLEQAPLADFLESIPAECSFVGAYDPLGLPGSFNSGVFAVRASATGRSIMDNWARCFDESVWAVDNGVWTTHGSWAGRCYEQGSFNECVLGHPECRRHIRLFCNDFVSFDFDGAGIAKHFPMQMRPLLEPAYRLFRADHSSVLCMHFGGEYHELVQQEDSTEYILRWPLRFPTTTCIKHDDRATDDGYWKWFHDGNRVNGWVHCRPDGSIKSSWFGVDGWWYRREEPVAFALNHRQARPISRSVC